MYALSYTPRNWLAAAQRRCSGGAAALLRHRGKLGRRRLFNNAEAINIGTKL
jgi:hypothetical protein